MPAAAPASAGRRPAAWRRECPCRLAPPPGSVTPETRPPGRLDRIGIGGGDDRPQCAGDGASQHAVTHRVSPFVFYSSPLQYRSEIRDRRMLRKFKSWIALYANRNDGVRIFDGYQNAWARRLRAFPPYACFSGADRIHRNAINNSAACSRRIGVASDGDDGQGCAPHGAKREDGPRGGRHTKRCAAASDQRSSRR